MNPEEVGRIVISNKPVKPKDLDDDIWTLLEKIFRPLEGRITCEEALNDPLFAGLDEATAFGAHKDTNIIREICNKYGLLSSHYGKTIKDRARAARKGSSSPIVKQARKLFFEESSETSGDTSESKGQSETEKRDRESY